MVHLHGGSHVRHLPSARFATRGGGEGFSSAGAEGMGADE